MLKLKSSMLKKLGNIAVQLDMGLFFNRLCIDAQGWHLKNKGT